jgi:hypothetical protein
VAHNDNALGIPRALSFNRTALAASGWSFDTACDGPFFFIIADHHAGGRRRLLLWRSWEVIDEYRSSSYRRKLEPSDCDCATRNAKALGPGYRFAIPGRRAKQSSVACLRASLNHVPDGSFAFSGNG